MKKTHRLIPFLLTALIVTDPAHRVEAKTRAPKKPATEQSPVTEPARELLTVESISFAGLESLNAQELIGNLPMKVNSKIASSGPELSNTLQYLWQLQLFSDIRVEKSDLGNNRVAIKFTVEELPVLDQVAFEGNSKFDSDELLKKSSLITGKRVSQQDLITASNKIEKLYAGKGYLSAGAEFKIEAGDKNHVKTKCKITEGPKVIIEKITFHGNSSFSQKTLRGVFKETTQNSWWRKIFGTPKLDKDKYNEDKTLIADFYRNNGFRDARILRDSISYTADKKGLFLDIYVEEGNKYHIGNITWTGNTKDFATTEILNNTFKIKKGDIYNQKLIQERLNFSQDNSDISSLYLDRGYLSFRPKLEEQIIKPDLVDLSISMKEGEQFQLNTITIKGNTKTKDHVIRRELYTVPGEMFSRKNVVRSIRELSMLNYFDPAQITPDIQPNQDNNTVDVVYNVAEKQTDNFMASVGYGSTGFTGGLGVTFNNFSLKDIFNGEAYNPLPHGDGQKLGVQWQFGNSSYNTLSLNFSEPWAFGTQTAVGVSVFKTHSAYDYTNDGIDNPTVIDQYGTTLSVGRRLDWPDDYTSVGMKLKYLNSTGGFLSFFQGPSSAPTKAEEYSITPTISRNSIDSPIFPRTGSINTISAELAGGPLPGTVDFYKFTGSSSWFMPISKKLVFNISTQQGYMSTFSNSDYIPYTEYFYMGGSGMSTLPTVGLRGYDDRSLGSPLETGSTLFAGKIYSKYTSELRYPFAMTPDISIYGVAFAEAGGLWQNRQSVKLSDLKKSAGLGVRLFLPIIGQIGLDYGYGFDAVESVPGKTKQGWKLLFSFGGQSN
ncbi:MAG: outer membrane protein assembly factor BamA [Chlorobiaceae bacterium]